MFEREVGENAGKSVKEGLVALADAIKYAIDKWVKAKIGVYN